jgi:sarcosine oxidase, subunit gamma
MSDAALNPLPCRGPLFERLAPLTSAWQEINGYRVSAHLRTSIAAGAPWLCDHTYLARVGFKGRGAAAWLQAQGLSLPDAPNRWLRDRSGATIARLGAEDFLLSDEAETHSGLPQDLSTRWHAASAPGGFPVPRQHGLAAFAVGGVNAPELLARLCALDLRARAFADDAIAQTQLALSSVVIMRTSVGAAATYRLFVDTSMALYLWDVLNDVAITLGGGAVGIAQQVGE